MNVVTRVGIAVIYILFLDRYIFLSGIFFEWSQRIIQRLSAHPRRKSCLGATLNDVLDPAMNLYSIAENEKNYQRQDLWPLFLHASRMFNDKN